MPTRRQALKTLAVATLATSAFAKFTPAFAADAPAAAPEPSGPYKLPPLPYAYDALEPSIDTETMHLHHDKHHAGYVKKLNEALAKEPSFTPPANVDDLVAHLDQVPESIRTAVRNQGGGHANHSLFWLTMAPHSDGRSMIKLSGAGADLNKAISDDVGGYDKLKATMTEEGGKVFGSGWVWLVLDGGKKLTVMTSANQDSPLTEGHYPLFGIDVWEHAYYLKYHNVRADYLAAIWNVINWDYISERYAKGMKA